jgi:hypothetical protein
MIAKSLAIQQVTLNWLPCARLGARVERGDFLTVHWR